MASSSSTKNQCEVENHIDSDNWNQLTLHQIANLHNLTIDDAKFCQLMDELDPLKHLRQEFYYPKMKDLPCVDHSLVNPEDDSIYFSGNSMGLQPRGVEKYINREIKKWAKMGVLGHFQGELPWEDCDEYTIDGQARIVGAKSREVAVMNGLSVNLHLLMISFYRPTEKRKKILFEDKAFPSDHFIIESQIRLHGYDPSDTMEILKPKEGEFFLRPKDIVDHIEAKGDEIALVLFSGVQYYTGQLFDIPGITKAAQAKGCVVGWDMAHAAGNVPLHLHEWGVDFAVWCSYKYLNSSCGSLGGVFVHEKHAINSYPKLSGWWGDDKQNRMSMTNELHLTPGAAGYRMSNPPVLLVCAILASLDVFNQTSMDKLRRKSILLTGYLEILLDKFLGENSAHRRTVASCAIVTPRQPEQRGCQLSLKFNVKLDKVFVQLQKRGVMCDKRLPFVLRITPVHMYNSFRDVRRFVDTLIDILKSCDDVIITK